MTNVDLIRAARSGTLQLDELSGNSHIQGEHGQLYLAAILATELMRKGSDFSSFRDGLVSRTGYGGFLSSEDSSSSGVDNQVRAMLLAKQNGDSLVEGSRLQDFVDSYVRRAGATDEHMASFLSTVMLHPLSIPEAVALTEATTNSGDVLNFERLRDQGYILGDKHSTGGIGDGISLFLAPLVASIIPYLKIPMMSGRSLGFTGGTLDKMESIGMEVAMSPAEIEAQLLDIGLAIFSQTEHIAPLDKRMYNMRDLVDAVPDIGLICASIMGKKLTENLDALVLDVKTGNGAFFSALDRAQAYARLAVDVGYGSKVATSAIVTDMNQPLGRFAGNRLEMIETIALLSGQWKHSRYVHVALALAEKLVSLAYDCKGDSGRRLNGDQLYAAGVGSDRLALAKFRQMVEAQKGDVAYVDRIASEYGDVSSDQTLYERLRRTSGTERVDVLKRALGFESDDLYVTPVVAGQGGYLTAVDVQPFGLAIKALGEGDDKGAPHTGFVTFAELNGRVAQGTELGLVVHRGTGGNPEAFGQYFTINETPDVQSSLVRQTFDKAV